MVFRVLSGALLGAALSLSASPQTVVVTVPPPGSQVGLPSAEVQGFVIGAPGPSPSAEVFIRTRYADGSLCPPIKRDGTHDPAFLGWGYDVDWDEVTGVGSFEGRIKWLEAGTNHIDIYLEDGALGTPAQTQDILYQPGGNAPKDVIALPHPLQRTVDVTDEKGDVGRIEFLLDILNTTLSQTYTVDVEATMELPDGSVVSLPMGGPGVNAVSYTVSPGDFTYTATNDPVGMKFSFPLDQVPIPQPIQEGVYHMELQVYDGPALLYEDEDIDFWVTDRTGKPFRDITNQTAFKDVYFQGGQFVGNGMAAFDYNGDGLTDLFATNQAGSAISIDALGFTFPYAGGNNYLIRNNGDGTWTDVSQASGAEGDPNIRSVGCAWGDIDRDGDNDLLVANRYFRPFVHRNNGDATFTEGSLHTFSAGFDPGWTTCVRLGDVNADGDLDMFLGTYVQIWKPTWVQQAYQNYLLENGLTEGVMSGVDPTFPFFTDISASSGVGNQELTLSAIFFDANEDGNLDLAVHNDFGGFVAPNSLYAGNGDGTFTEISAAAGYDVKEFSMGATVEDFDGDGHLDVYSTSIGRNSLLFGGPGGSFTQGIVGSGAEADFMVVGPQADGLNLDNNWAALGFDYDLDRDLDLYVMGSDMFTMYQIPIGDIHPDNMFENDGTGSFTQQSDVLGLENGGRGRGAVLIDIDQDGDLDIIVSNKSEGLTVSRNDLVSSNHRLDLRPVTRRSAPGGFNTRIEVTSGGVTQLREVNASSPHTGQLDNLLQYGLAADTSAAVTAHWQRGGSTTWFSLPADTEHALVETVIEVNGEIDGTAKTNTAPVIRLLGPSGGVGIAFLGFPGALPIPSGGTTDLFPAFNFMTLALFDAGGEALWSLGTIPPQITSGTVDAQLITFDVFTSAFPSKSGVSSLTVTP